MKKLGDYTIEEVARHNTQSDMWIVVDDEIYDVSKWAKYHPGGEIIFKYAGMDATEVFYANHMPSIWKKLKPFHIGHVQNPPPLPSFSKDYRRIAKELYAHGMYDTNYVFYAQKVGVCVLLLLSSLYCQFVLESVVASAVLVGLFFQQCAFIGHDALHNGITHNRKIDSWIGWCFTSAAMAIPSQWWKDNHHLHHALTNVVDRNDQPTIDHTSVKKPAHWNGESDWHGDPQMVYTPIWITDKKLLKDYTGLKVFGMDLFALLLRVQHWTFLPLHVVIGRWNIYILGLLNVIKGSLWADLAGLVIYWSWFSCLAYSWWSVSASCFWVYMLISHSVAGIMHLQLNVTHFGQPMLFRDEFNKNGFFYSQLATSRNIDSSWRSHWFHGGLEFQNEHHLFPMLPRHNLEAAKRLILPLCEKYDVPYQSSNFFSAISYILGDLRRLALDPLGDSH